MNDTYSQQPIRLKMDSENFKPYVDHLKNQNLLHPIISLQTQRLLQNFSSIETLEQLKAIIEPTAIIVTFCDDNQQKGYKSAYFCRTQADFQQIRQLFNARKISWIKWFYTTNFESLNKEFRQANSDTASIQMWNNVPSATTTFFTSSQTPASEQSHLLSARAISSNKQEIKNKNTCPFCIIQ